MAIQGSGRTPTLAEVIRAAIDSRLQDVHVALPGKIERYDATTQKADIKPLVKRRLAAVDGTELEPEALPVIPDVPIVFPRASQFFLSFPLVPGDHVLLIFCERSIDNFMLAAPGQDTDPGDFAAHDLSDAVAYPGLWPFARALAQVDTANMVMGQDAGGVQIHLTPLGTMEIKVNGVAAHHVAIGELLQAWYTTSVKVAFDTHVHPTGMGPSGVPAAPLPAFDPSIISTVLALKGP